MIGRRLLHYTIESEIGAGGMGQVFLARDERADRPVAIKLLRDAGGGPEARAGLIREARAAARLSHPGIVTLYAVEEAEGLLFLIQEYVAGETLAARLARTPLGASEVIRLAREMAAALGHAHRHGVLHRDLKPENILVTADGHYKVADFGIARLDDVTSQTTPDLMGGTLPYMAPERCSGEPGDARSDLFALGAILYEALSGRRAFGGRSATETLLQILNETPPPLELPGPTGDALGAIVARLLSKSPGDRPSTADQLLGQLEGLETSGTGPRTATAAVPAPPVAATPTATRRGPGLILAILALVALAVAALIWRGRSVHDSAAAANASVAVLYFENLADPADSERIGAITGNLIVTSLAQSSRLEVLSSQTIVDALQSLARGQTRVDRDVALKVARKVKAGRIVTGSILQVTPAIVMTAEVSDVRSGKLIRAARVEGRPGETIFQVVDQMSARLLPPLAGESEGEAGRLQPVADRSTTDLVALRAYVEGMEKLMRGDYSGAGGELRRAVERDTTYAQALYALAISQWWSGEPVDAAADLARARAHRDRLPRVEQDLVEALSLLVNYDYAEAGKRFGEFAARAPNDKLVAYGQLEAAFHSEDYALAIAAARRALAADSTFDLVNVHYVDALVGLGRVAEAESLGMAFLARNPRNEALYGALGEVLVRQARGVEADSLLRRARREGFTPTPLVLLGVNKRLIGADMEAPGGELPDLVGYGISPELAKSYRTHLELLRLGHFNRDMALAEQVHRKDVTRGDLTFGPHDIGIDAAIELGREREARAWSEILVSRLSARTPFLAVGYRFSLIDLEVALGHPDRARQRLAASEREIVGLPPAFATSLRFARAQVLLSEGRATEALPELEGVAPALVPSHPAERWVELRLTRAACLEALGRNAEALASVDSVLAAPAGRVVRIIRAHETKGRLLEALGRREEAVAAYRRFLDIWKDADPGTRGVAEARAAVKRLAAAPLTGSGR